MRRCILLLVVSLCFPAFVRAQAVPPAPVSPAACRAAGLERAWFTQLGLDRGRGRLAGISMHVSAIQSHTVFQISHDGKRFVFSQRDRDAFGKEIGIEGARKAAESKAEEIVKKALQDAGKPDTDVPAPQVESYVVPKITIYASSERGGMHAVDGETGRTLWTAVVGNPSYATSSPGANDKYVGVCNGSTLYIMRTSDGSVVWTKSMVGAPGLGVALTDDYVFIPMVNGQVESLALEKPKLPAGLYKSFGRTVLPPVVSSSSVAWTTEAGNLYVALAHAPGLRFRMKATDALNSSAAFLAPDKVFINSIDGYIYCIGESKGNILWRFSTGEPIAHTPITLGNSVYTISERGNLFAIDVETASERWVAGGIADYLAGNDKRLYCLDVRGNLAILDTATGTRVGSVPSVPADMPFLNSQTDRIFLVSSTGLLQCLHEVNRPWPVVHFQIEPYIKPTVALPKKADQKASQPLETDPFGAPGGSKPAASGADPFSDPKPAVPAAGGDPFAPKS
jgi:outer membrane protein assembly factor BamB